MLAEAPSEPRKSIELSKLGLFLIHHHLLRHCPFHSSRLEGVGQSILLPRSTIFGSIDIGIEVLGAEHIPLGCRLLARRPWGALPTVFQLVATVVTPLGIVLALQTKHEPGKEEEEGGRNHPSRVTTDNTNRPFPFID